MDEQHSGPPDTVLPWLEQQHNMDTQHGREREGGGDRERGREREGGGDREGGGGREGGGKEMVVDTKLPAQNPATHATLESTVDPLCTMEQTRDNGGTSREHALVQEEEKEVGVVAVRVYLAYWTAVGTILAPAIFLALFLMQGTCTCIYSVQSSSVFFSS